MYNSGSCIKVYPYSKSKINISKTPHKPDRNYQCTCKIIKLCANSNRIFGRFPYSWKHINGICVYKISIPWMIYSVGLMAILGLISYYNMTYLKFNPKNLPVFLDSLINLLNSVHVCFPALHLINIKVWIDFVKGLNKLNKDYLFCQQSRNMVKMYQKSVVLICIFMSVLQGTIFVVFKYSYAHDISLHILFFRSLTNLPILSYGFLFSCGQYCTSMFICFENVVKYYLGYEQIHPIKSIKFTNNTYQFLGFLREKTVCDEQHYIPEHLRNLSRAELIEYLRIKHEEMYQNTLLLQHFSSPQLLIYIIFEVATNAVSWFSIIVYLLYEFENPTANNTFIFNCIYVIWHGTGLFWFIKNIHMLKKLVQGLKPILTACALKARTVEEHQQFRIFLNKLAFQQPITLNGFFELDLGIIGPVVGSILTYVLVALQFEIPPQEPN